VEKPLTKKELLSHPQKESLIEKAKNAILKEMDRENRVLFRTLTKEQQDDFIMDLAYEDDVIQFKAATDIKAQ